MFTGTSTLYDTYAHLQGNLLWTHNGSVWAMWRMRGVAYGLRSKRDRKTVRDLHKVMMQQLRGEVLCFGLTTAEGPAGVVRRMIEGIDLNEAPEWAAEVEATWDVLEDVPMGSRAFWMAVPLSNPGLKMITEPLKAGVRQATRAADLGSGLPPQEDIAFRMGQMREIEDFLPKAFHPRRATVSDYVWIAHHSQSRGLSIDFAVPGSRMGINERTDEETILHAQQGSVIPTPVIDEGAQSDETARTVHIAKTRPVLKVTQPGSDESSYQTLLALSGVPAGGVEFPGSEYLNRLDETGLEVDFVDRWKISSKENAARKNRSASKKVFEQADQREGDQAALGRTDLDRSMAEQRAYVAELDSTENEVEVEVTSIFAVSGSDVASSKANAKALAQWFKNVFEYKLHMPIGGQEELWDAMQPGSVRSRLVRDYAQLTTSRNAASSVPMAMNALGDDIGMCFALNRSGGRNNIVILDLEGASTTLEVSASIGIAGELGAGKSFCMKKIVGGVVDRGGSAFMIDHSDSAEWAIYLKSVVGSEIVDFKEPERSIDPLRILGQEEGGEALQSFLAPLLSLDLRSTDGTALSELLDPEYLTEFGITSTPTLLEHMLSDACEVENAKAIGRKLRNFAQKKFARAMFDDSLPPLDIKARAVVAATRGVNLPTKDELQSPHLFKQMRLDKIFGRAVYALLAALGRQYCFADRSRLAIFGVDETHHVTGSPEGEAEIMTFIREGRKALASVLLGSHDPEADFGSDTLRGLIPTRIVMRHRDDNLARKSLKWLGFNETDDTFEDFVKELTEDTSPVTVLENGEDGVDENRRGEGFMRDSRGRPGRIQVLPPARKIRHIAAKASPGEAALREQQEMLAEV